MFEGKFIELECTYPGYKLISYDINCSNKSFYNENGYHVSIENDKLYLYIDFDVFNEKTYNFINKNKLLEQIEKMEKRKSIIKYLMSRS